MTNSNYNINPNPSIIYFSKDLSPSTLIKLYDIYNKELKGNIAIKLHSGEEGNKNFIKPEFVKPIIDKLKGTVVECNTAYPGSRNTTIKHNELMNKHGWTKYFNVDIMDSNSYKELLIPNGIRIKKNYVGSNIFNYDSMLVISHFKGHPMGGFGGALKQLSIGCASSEGKCYIHSAGKVLSQDELWSNIAPQNHFIESMADASSSIVNLFKGNILYINIIVNLSVDCDCCSDAEEPCMKDIGICISDDPVAIDQFCIDQIYNSNDSGKEHFIERVESRNGRYILDCANTLGIGSREYKVIEII